MDSFAALLDGPRARGAFLLRCVLNPPWSLLVQDQAPLTVVSVVRGRCVVLPSGSDTMHLGDGDVAVLRGPDPYVVADSPHTPPQAIIHPGQHCTDPDGNPLTGLTDLGVRTWGSSPDGATVLLTGTYQLASEVSRRLLAALPTALAVHAADWRSPLLGHLADEVNRDAPGQEVVLDRLLDLLLIGVLRTWLARPDAQAPGWYAAQSDPVVGAALRLIHERPEQPWTVASLASAAGVSRAALARRFHDLVGEPPMSYLTGWRLARAADLLREPGATVSAVAHQVGYGSGFALSTAFKRVRGTTPTQHRGSLTPAQRP
ncbi:AraC family transcriptional regulator [Jannaschia sp. R86511]|uniref:AraC family transcriptional regulator n=1 Tax=Jannaschia sp. R86511 TaxID=3093853 RepID=UPI0036D35F38